MIKKENLKKMTLEEYIQSLSLLIRGYDDRLSVELRDDFAQCLRDAADMASCGSVDDEKRMFMIDTAYKILIDRIEKAISY